MRPVPVPLAADPRPSWSRWREIPRVVLYPPHLARTIGVALLIGTVLLVINQLDVILRGDATARTWIKAGVTYVVPFCVSNWGLLLGRRRPS